MGYGETAQRRKGRGEKGFQGKGAVWEGTGARQDIGKRGTGRNEGCDGMGRRGKLDGTNSV